MDVFETVQRILNTAGAVVRRYCNPILYLKGKKLVEKIEEFLENYPEVGIDEILRKFGLSREEAEEILRKRRCELSSLESKMRTMLNMLLKLPPHETVTYRKFLDRCVECFGRYYCITGTYIHSFRYPSSTQLKIVREKIIPYNDKEYYFLSYRKIMKFFEGKIKYEIDKKEAIIVPIYRVMPAPGIVGFLVLRNDSFEVYSLQEYEFLTERIVDKILQNLGITKEFEIIII